MTLNSAKKRKEPQVTLEVEGMTCDHCVQSVTKALKNVPGVSESVVRLDPPQAEVWGDNLNTESLIQAVEDAGFSGKPMETSNRIQTASCGDDGCTVPEEPAPQSEVKTQCPHCGTRGKNVEIVTLKSLLVSKALKRLNATSEFRFCRSQDCPVVYFSSGQEFLTQDLKVAVFQKDSGDDVPVCYCFDRTRASLADEVRREGRSQAVAEITRLVQEGHCACEFRNPQGDCCLGNVSTTLKVLQKRETVE